MENTTMTMNAVACVLSVRPGPIGQLLLADVQGQGTTVSVVARQGRGLAVAGALVEGVAMRAAVTFDPDYKPTDVARSRLGRPPV